ncbi:putative C4-type zinc finger protein [Acinetobacter phage vB_AbaM_CP14]|nr:putative C4-type zinc finger protein [Acinetobacter phage vB_AbaM_CP14]
MSKTISPTFTCECGGRVTSHWVVGERKDVRTSQDYARGKRRWRLVSKGYWSMGCNSCDYREKHYP